MGTSMPLADFAKSLAPDTYDKTRAKERRDDIEEELKKKTDCAGMIDSGSWTHGTALTGRSDVDWMALFPKESRPVYPSSALASLKTALDGAHWAIWRLKQSSPTVQVEFYSQPNFEIVPAYFLREVGVEQLLSIPGPGNEWIESAPIAHLRFVTEQNVRLDSKLKPLVRLLKAWKYHVGAPVSSFYLEMRAAQYAEGESSIVYDIDLRRVMDSLEDIKLRSMNDPTGLVSRIPATSSEVNRVEAMRLVRRAQDALTDAMVAKTKSDALNYYYAMSQLFGSNFPYPSW